MPQRLQPPAFSDSDKTINWLLNVHEKYYIELKKAQELPRSFWESYSSFANTCGGWIILGVLENRPQNEILGVANADKLLTSLWDQLSNPEKISFRCIGNEDVQLCVLNGKKVVIVYVNEAPESQKPVYINGKLENTYIRTGDGDRLATREELQALLRNAHSGQDSLPIPHFSLDDLDNDTVLSFKEKVHIRYPKKKYLEMSNEAFLTEIGACFLDRNTQKITLKKGTLLFLGKLNSIKELYPHFHLDYFNRRGNNPRWIDRVSDDEPSDYEMNLYNFYRIVYDKLRILLQEPFHMDSYQMRLPVSDFDETLRECLVNTLAHADYTQGYPSTKIDVYDGWFCFTNPGKMLISPRQFVAGGDSRPRNEIIMKMFRLLGASERQGFGGPLIFKSALVNNYRQPEIHTDIEHTELKVWNIDLADSYPDLDTDEKNVLRFILKSRGPRSIREIAESLHINTYQARKITQSLVDGNRLQKLGNGPSTKYTVVIQSGEMLTQLQIVMDELKKSYAQEHS